MLVDTIWSEGICVEVYAIINYNVLVASLRKSEGEKPCRMYNHQPFVIFEMHWSALQNFHLLNSQVCITGSGELGMPTSSIRALDDDNVQKHVSSRSW